MPEYVYPGLGEDPNKDLLAKAGALTTTAPATATNVVRLFGFARSTTVMKIVDDFDYTVVSA